MKTLTDFFERCPVCRARLKDAMECRRCGLDFSPLLRTAEEAQRLALQARRELRLGRQEEAFVHALRAARMHISPETLNALALAALALRYFDLALALWRRMKDDAFQQGPKKVKN